MPVVADNLFDPAYTENAHPYSPWDALRKTTAVAHVKSQADTDANAARVVLCVEDIGANTYRVLEAKAQRVKLETAHGLGGSFGDWLYLSPSTAGLITRTRPSNDATERLIYLGYVVDLTTIYWDPWPWSMTPSDAPEKP